MPNCRGLSNQICIDVSGSYRPCCRFANHQKVDVSSQTFESYKNTEFFKDILNKMNSGWHEGCFRCQDEESAGKHSLRMYYNKLIPEKTENIEFMELALSNTCNLTCRMCSPKYSSKWVSKLKHEPHISKYFFKNTAENISLSFSKIWKENNLKNLKHVKYLGGEPFLTSEISEMIDLLDENNIIENVEFISHTNVTFFPEKLIEKLKRFKKVRIKFSIDGIDELASYIRIGSDWANIIGNIKKWTDLAEKNQNFSLGIFCTLQAYNLHQIERIQNLSKTLNIPFDYSFLSKPKHLSVAALPTDYVKKCIDSIRNISYFSPLVNQVNKIEHSESLFVDFCKYTKETDTAFNQSLSSVNSELGLYLNSNSP